MFLNASVIDKRYLVNLDMQDISLVMKNTDTMDVVIVEAGKTEIVKEVDRALAKFRGKKYNVLISFEGDRNTELNLVRDIGEKVMKYAGKSGIAMWGAKIAPKVKDIKATVMLFGRSKHRNRKTKSKKK